MKIEVNAMLGDILSCPLNSKAASLYVVMEGIRYVEDSPAEKVKIQEFTVLYKIAPDRRGTPEFHGTPDHHGTNIIEDATVFERKYMSVKGTSADPHLLQRSKQLGKILSNVPCNANEEILLITWDHGSAFGIFRDEDPKAPTAHLRSAITDHLDHYPWLKRFWHVAMQSKDLSLMVEKKARQPRHLVVQVKHSLYTIKLSADKAGEWHRLRQKPGVRMPLTRGKKGELRLKNAGRSLSLGKKAIPEILKNWELAAALKLWLRDKGQNKVGVVVMLNCWMMNLHTLYNLRERVKYLVAPEGNIDNPGYNYHDILLYLYNHPRTPSPQELAVHVVRTSHNEFMVERAKQLNKEFPMTLTFRSIVNVRLDYGPSEVNELGQLFGTLHHLIGTVYRKLTNDRSGAFLLLLQHVRALSFDFTDGLVPMVDLPNYLFNIIAATNGLKKPVFAKTFEDKVNKLQAQLMEGLPVVLPRWIGERCYVENHEPIFTKLLSLKPSGFSVFFPNGKQIGSLVLDNVRDDLLMEDYFVRWKRILDKVHGGKRLP